MDWSMILQALETVSILAAILVAVGTLRGRGDDKTVALTEMRVDIKYIKERVNSIDELRDIGKSAMQSAKSAHSRLDEHLRMEHFKDVPRRP